MAPLKPSGAGEENDVAASTTDILRHHKLDCFIVVLCHLINLRHQVAHYRGADFAFLAIECFVIMNPLFLDALRSQ